MGAQNGCQPTGLCMRKWWSRVGMANEWKSSPKIWIAARRPCVGGCTASRRDAIEGLGDRPRPGRPRRLTAEDDSRIIALARSIPPGKLERLRSGELDVRDEQGEAHWSLNALADAAQEAGIQIKRSQVRRICVREGVRWRRTHSWGESDDKDFVPKGERSSATTSTPQQARRPSVPMNWGQFCLAVSLQHLDDPRVVTDTSASGVQPRAGEDVDLWSLAGARWQRTDALCLLTQFGELH